MTTAQIFEELLDVYMATEVEVAGDSPIDMKQAWYRGLAFLVDQIIDLDLEFTDASMAVLKKYLATCRRRGIDVPKYVGEQGITEVIREVEAAGNVEIN